MSKPLNLYGKTYCAQQPSRFCITIIKKVLRSFKATLPVAAISLVCPQALAAGGNDLMASGDATVGATFGKDSSVVKWVILAEVLVGGVMYMTTKNLKFLAGFAILSVFIAIGMSVAGY